jgi:hypothetical protein
MPRCIHPLQGWSGWNRTSSQGSAFRTTLVPLGGGEVQSLVKFANLPSPHPQPLCYVNVKQFVGAMVNFLATPWAPSLGLWETRSAFTESFP